jgi:hypothetical protein
VSKLVLTLLVIPLIIIMVARNPQVMGHLVVVVFTVCARLLDGLAALLNALTGGHAAH